MRPKTTKLNVDPYGIQALDLSNLANGMAAYTCLKKSKMNSESKQVMKDCW